MIVGARSAEQPVVSCIVRDRESPRDKLYADELEDYNCTGGKIPKGRI